jgi:hypothetical protein
MLYHQAHLNTAEMRIGLTFQAGQLGARSRKLIAVSEQHFTATTISYEMIPFRVYRMPLYLLLAP